MLFKNIFKNKKNNEDVFIEDDGTMVNDEEGTQQENDEVPDNIFPFASKAKTVSKSTTTVMVVNPISFDDAQQVADYIKNHKPVVVNFEKTDKEVAKRIIDFMGGTAYALAGKLTKVGQNVFMCSPANVSVEAEDNPKYTTAPANPWEE